ncbi:hypothetical protein [Sneathiella sp.]|uniref:hypothetical protein n=1 Tax=Sneathiella sp. TaxID=1964365 RepID=UPI00260221E0|nr:hypothetical protein [Sneathiella sp.]MDF2366456.1 hypothetical protein [Sneathiella sp.]
MKKLTVSAIALAMLATPAMAGWNGPSSGGGGGGAGAGNPDLSVDSNGVFSSVSGNGGTVTVGGSNSVNLASINTGNALSVQNINDSLLLVNPLKADPDGGASNPFNVSNIMAYSHFQTTSFNFNKLSGDDTNPDAPAVNVEVIAIAAAGAGADTGSSSPISGHFNPGPVLPSSPSAEAGAVAGVGVGVSINSSPVEVVPDDTPPPSPEN